MGIERQTQRPHGTSSGLWVNAGLAVLKGVTGWLTGSHALLADGLRSGSESARCYAAMLGAKSMFKPVRRGSIAKKQRVNGEQAANLVLSLLLLVIGIELAISAVRDITAGVYAAPAWPAPFVIAGAWLTHVLLAGGFQRRIETYVSGILFLAVGGAWLGGAIGQPVLYYLDPAAVFFVAVVVTVQGYRIVADSLIGSKSAVLTRTDEAQLSEAVQRVQGVIAVEGLHAWEQGHYLAVEVSISVNPRITVLEGQDIARRVKDGLLKRFTHVTEVQVQVDPYDPGYPYKSNHDPNQEHMPTLLQ